MKYEPLKGKERVIQYIGSIRRMDGGIHRMPFIKRGFLTDDVKSAVQGLLQEINKNIKRWEETMEKADETTRERIASRIDELEFCKDLVKKWMPDVVEVVGNESSL